MVRRGGAAGFGLGPRVYEVDQASVGEAVRRAGLSWGTGGPVMVAAGPTWPPSPGFYDARLSPPYDPRAFLAHAP